MNNKVFFSFVRVEEDRKLTWRIDREQYTKLRRLLKFRILHNLELG